MGKRFVNVLVSVFILVLCVLPNTFFGQSASELSSKIEVDGWTFVIDVSEEMVDTSRFKKQAPYTIGFVSIFMENSWAVQLVEEFLAEAEKYDSIKQVIHLDAQGQVSRQISIIEDLIARNVDAIVIDPVSPVALQGVLKEAQRKNIPVIAVSSQIPLDQVTSWVGRDDREYGKITAQWLVEELNYKGNIIALSGIAGNPVAEERWAGAKEVFDKYPEIKILTRQFADWGRAQAKAKMANILAAYPDIDGVWSDGGAMTQGAMEAFKDAGRSFVPMTGEANNGFLLDWIEASEEGFTSIAFNNPTSVSAIGLKLALKVLNGEPIPKSVNATGPYILSLEKAKEYADPTLADDYWLGTTLSREKLEQLWGIK